MTYDWIILIGSAALLSIGAVLGYWSRNSTSRKLLSDVGVQDAIQKARNGEFPPLVGRDTELKRMVQVLTRKRKPHVLLVGESGVGKTTLAQSMGTVLAERKVPRALRTYRMFQWNLGEWLAYSESNEELLKFLTSFRKPCMVLMDNLEEWWGVLERRGLLSLLFEGLSRRGISVIGVTTPQHQKQHIHAHPRLSRFFHPIHVAESTATNTIRILETMTEEFKEQHGIQLKPSALKACVSYARHHLPHDALPGSAVEVLEEVVTLAANREHWGSSRNRVITQVDVEEAMEHRTRHYRDPRD